MPEPADTCHQPLSDCSEIAAAYLDALLEADRSGAHEIITKALQRGLAIRDLYLDVFQPVQHEVGRLWLNNRVSIAEEHFCTAATQTIMSELYPQIITSRRIGKTLVAACVGSELHEIGIRMVADFFEMEGWDTYYIGAGIKVEQIVSAILLRKPDMLALSVTMTCHVAKMREIISAIRSTYLVNTPQIMVGGRPFNLSPELWRSVGADIWAADAEQAVLMARASVHG